MNPVRAAPRHYNPRMSRLVAALALACSLAVLACGDNTRPAIVDAGPDAPSAPDAPAAWTAARVCAAISEKICAELSTCGCRFDLRPYDATTCAAARTAQCTQTFADRIAPDLASGAAHLDGPSIDRCVAAISCTDPAGAALPHACDTIVVASAALGAACTITGNGLAYCADGAGVCAPDGGGGGLTCTALPGDGAPCPYQLCASGLVCGAADGACHPPAGDGGACVIASDCAPGLVCPDGAHCRPPLALGDACTDYRACATGLTCSGGHCATATALGDACRTADQCGPDRGCGRAPELRTCGTPDAAGDACGENTCGADLGCSATTMTCVALPADGQPCLDGTLCDTGLTCVDGLGTCAPLPGVGETCASGNRFCRDGLGCDQTDNTCRTPPGANQPCLLNPPDYVCGAGLGCDFQPDGSICVARGGAGSACTNDRVCTADTYCDFHVNQCATRLADGAACSAGNECRAGSECAWSPSGYHCAPIPGRDQPCDQACTASLACKGDGGACMQPICLVP